MAKFDKLQYDNNLVNGSFWVKGTISGHDDQRSTKEVGVRGIIMTSSNTVNQVK